MRRVLAVIGAVLIIVAAAAVRSMIDDDAGSGRAAGGDGELVVLCDTDLRVACEALEGVEVRSQPAADTAAAADQGPADDVDVWITTSAWLEVLQSRAPDAVEATRAIASSPVTVAALPGRGEALTTTCAGRALLRCVGDSARRPWSDLGGQATWGRLTVGFPDPDHAIGLTVLAAATDGYFGGSDFARNDFDDDPGFRPWLEGLYSEAPDTSPIRTMVTAQGRFSVASDVRARATADAGQRAIEVLDLDDAMAATVVAVRLAGGDDIPNLGPARDALVMAGWDAADGEAPPPTLKPGVMAALHSLWTETTG